MTLVNYDKLKRRDFENGAVLDDIRSAIKQRDELLARVAELEAACKLADELIAELVDRAYIGNDDKGILRDWTTVKEALDAKEAPDA